LIINGDFSDWGRIEAGVPQGSVLGPLLFLIFINDIAHVINHCKIRLFADDTCLFIEVDDPDDTANDLNQDLEKLNQWANKWHVDFSPPKTEELIISRKRTPIDHPLANLDGTPIHRVQNHKHLGLTLSTDLSWNTHINEIVNKANKRLGIMRTLKYKLDRLSLEKIHLGFIRPILEYGDVVWDSPLEILNQLDMVQKNAARIVVGATARSSTEGLIKETAWEPLDKRREFHRLLLMYKILNGKAPSYLEDLVPETVASRTNYGLRNRGNLDPPPARLNVYANSFVPKTTQLWNNLPMRRRNAPSIEAFKTYHKLSLPKKNSLYYLGNRTEAMHHARLRIGNSLLNADLNKLNVVPSPQCLCQGGIENAKHFFFGCNLFTNQRDKLIDDLLPLVIDDTNHLLFGIPDADHPTNLQIFNAVHKFIKDSNRFK
jgi:hypothetical protein